MRARAMCLGCVCVSLSLSLSVCVCVRACVRVCVCARAHVHVPKPWRVVVGGHLLARQLQNDAQLERVDDVAAFTHDTLGVDVLLVLKDGVQFVLQLRQVANDEFRERQHAGHQPRGVLLERCPAARLEVVAGGGTQTQEAA